MRKLASIKRISDIQPIDGKDRIVLATVDGWHVIVHKDEYNVGDCCVFVEIDSILPERQEFEFLRSKKFRVKTMKMGSVVSQGICFPLSVLPVGDYQIDQDVTDLIGVKQYGATIDDDPPPPPPKPLKEYPGFLMRMKWFRRLVLPKKKNADFPSFLSKTDETRIQNCPFILEEDETWVATEKIDGSSGTFALVRKRTHIPFMKDRFEFIVCSRNKRLPVNDQSFYWKIAEMYLIKDALESMIGQEDWVAIQGECVGPKIQGNKYRFYGYHFFVFNVIYPGGRLDSVTAEHKVVSRGLKFVPILDTRVRLPKTVDEVLARAHGQSMLADTLREGIVFRSMDGKKSFKAVDPLFLIQHDE